jgi:hypothetical protein
MAAPSMAAAGICLFIPAGIWVFFYSHRRRAHGPRADRVCGERGDVRGTTYSSGTARGGAADQHEACRPPDAASRPGGPPPEARPGHDDRFATRRSHRAKPPRAGLRCARRRPESGVGGGHHLHPDPGGLLVSLDRLGPRLASLRRLGHAGNHGGRPGDERAADGAGRSDTGARLDLPFGSRQSRRIQPVVATPSTERCLWGDPQDG